MLSTLRVITRLSLQPRHQASLQIRTLASIPTIATKSSQDLSNRQKFKQLQPPLKLYEKLERLGFGTLLKTKRFSGLHKQKERKDQQKLKHTTRVGPPPEPKYSVSQPATLDSFCGLTQGCYNSFRYFHSLQAQKHQSRYQQSRWTK